MFLPGTVTAQVLTGALIGTVKDEQGGALPGAQIRVTSPAVIGGSLTTTTNEKGLFRFPVLQPGTYAIAIELKAFAPYHEEGISIGTGATLERTAVLALAGVAESVVVEGSGSRVEVRSSGIETRIGPEYLKTIPTRRFSMFDSIRAAPGVSPTSPSSGTVNTVSAFGSGGNENLFLIDGTNFTCPCAGVSRAEPSVDVIQEMQVQSIGVSAEYGNIQGTVFNVITKQGGDRFQYDAWYYGQAASLTSQPVERSIPGSTSLSGYERVKSATSRRTWAALSSVSGCGSSRDTSTSVTTTANPARTPRSQGPTSRKDLRQGDLEADAESASHAERAPRVLGQPRPAHVRHPV